MKELIDLIGATATGGSIENHLTSAFIGTGYDVRGMAYLWR